MHIKSKAVLAAAVLTAFSTAAMAPNMCEIAVRCGTAVIGMKMAMTAPMMDPSTIAPMIHS